MSIIKDIFTVNRKTFFNPSKWIDADGIVASNSIIRNILRSIWTKPAAGQAESFEEALKRLNLSESDVANIVGNYRYYALMLVCFGLLSLFYGFYLLFRFHSFTAWLITLGMTALFFAYAFFDLYSPMQDICKKQMHVPFVFFSAKECFKI